MAVAAGVNGGSPVGGRSLSMRSENTVDSAFILDGMLLPKEDVEGEVGTVPDIEPTRRWWGDDDAVDVEAEAEDAASRVVIDEDAEAVRVDSGGECVLGRGVNDSIASSNFLTINCRSAAGSVVATRERNLARSCRALDVVVTSRSSSALRFLDRCAPCIPSFGWLGKGGGGWCRVKGGWCGGWERERRG